MTQRIPVYVIRTIEPNSIFLHYKGSLYCVVNVSEHTETKDLLVNYYDITKPNQIWSRPLEMFNEYINIDGVDKLRFEELKR
jgi:hypothetical protein